MAFFEMKYFSDTLKVSVSVNVILPEKAKNLIGMSTQKSDTYKTLYLLHGLSDDHTVWVRRTSIERYASQYGIAVVMPAVGRSWYIDTAYGGAYFTFITEELPRVCQGFFKGMSSLREDNFIAGLSMGGYGAVKAALSYPDKFGGCASLSGSLNFVNIARDYLGNEVKELFGAEYSSNTELEGTKHDVFHLAKALERDAYPIPKMYFWCGTEDFLLKANRDFDQLLNELEIPHAYEESEGDHSWKWWDLHVQDALKVSIK